MRTPAAIQWVVVRVSVELINTPYLQENDFMVDNLRKPNILIYLFETFRTSGQGCYRLLGPMIILRIVADVI